MVFIKVEENDQVCTTCLQSFATPEELTRHLENIKIKTLCHCTTCENAVDPDSPCDHPSTEKKYMCVLCNLNLDYGKFEEHFCFHGHCHACLKTFLTSEELYGHVNIKTMCMCNTCGNFFGATHCPHPDTAKTFFCFHCGLTLHFSELHEHLCFHGKAFRVRRREEYSEDEEPKAKRSRPKTLISIYSRVKHKYLRAKTKYVQEVEKIRYGYYETHRYVESSEDSESEIEDNDTLLVEVSEEEKAPCVFCLEDVSLPILPKHESKCLPKRKHRSVDQPVQKNPLESFQEKKILCYVCGDFYRSCKFRFHMLTHKKVKAVLCEICGVPSKCIKVHMTKHSEKRNFSCDKCGMAFKTSKTLAVHSLVHTKVGTHKCPTCEKLFKNAYNLRVHIRTHMDKKPFECTICKKSFTTKQWRDNHVKTHK